jgi:hypothetical protein
MFLIFIFGKILAFQDPDSIATDFLESGSKIVTPIKMFLPVGLEKLK